MHKVGCLIGKVEEIDTLDNGFAIGRFACIRVRIDVTKPLKKTISMSVDKDSESIFVILAYECLPTFCYNCGCLGHSFRDCELALAEFGKMVYGDWLRETNLKGGDKIERSPLGGNQALSWETSNGADQSQSEASNSASAMVKHSPKAISVYGGETHDMLKEDIALPNIHNNNFACNQRPGLSFKPLPLLLNGDHYGDQIKPVDGDGLLLSDMEASGGAEPYGHPQNRKLKG